MQSLKNAEDFLKNTPKGIAVFGSAREKADTYNYKSAYLVGKILAESSIPVITGGGPGIMEAANKGAFEAGGVSVGINIYLPCEQKPNSFLTTSFEAEGFPLRKSMLVYLSRGAVFFPGGFGTLDELTEIFTLLQTEKIVPIPLVLIGNTFWQGFFSWLEGTLIPAGYIARGDMNFPVFDRIEDALGYLKF